MIIFYHKKTGEIFGTVGGRIHDEDQIKNAMIKPENVDVEDIGKWITPFKPVFDTVYEPIVEQQVVTSIVKEKIDGKIRNKKIMKVQDVVIGEKKVEKPNGMIPDGKFSKFVEKFDKESSEVYKYRIKFDKNGDIENFVEK